MKRICFLFAFLFFGGLTATAQTQGIWISPSELSALPTSGSAWNNLKSKADQSCGSVDLTNQDQSNNVCILAKALVFARTGQTSYRNDVVSALQSIVNMGTYDGRALALGRELGAYVVAADLINLKGYNPSLDTLFRAKIKLLLTTPTLSGPSDLIDCHESRPNNWGTHCGGARAAVAAYLGDTAEMARVAKVFKGWLGDRSSYAGFSYGDLSWQCSSSAPVGINPKGCSKSGYSIDGVLPDDQRRGGGFTWPPPQENYVYEALQGALMQAVILQRAGYDAFNWQDQALLRAFQWLRTQANYDAEGDDTWMPHIINYFYGTSFPAPIPTTAGKNMGWSDWTHAGTYVESPVLSATPTSLSFSATQGGTNPATKSIQVSNTGGGTLNWSAAGTQSWLTVNPTSGTGVGTISVGVLVGGLAAGTYTDTVVINANQAQGSPTQVSVTFTVNPAPQSVSSMSLSPNPVAGGTSSTGTVTIAAPAPSGGVAVALSSNSTMANVPSSVTVAAGNTTATFTATTSTVTVRQQATITGSLNGSVQAVLIVDPPAADTTAPVISSVTAGFITATSASVSWNTSEGADTQVEYGTSTAYGASTPLNTTQVTSHAANLGGLLAGTVYHYRVKSRDAAGNLAVSGNFTFTTAPASAGPGCTTSSSSWQNASFPSQSSSFTVRFDATPNAANMDGITGLSQSAATGYSSLAAIVRFNPSGRIDARDGSAYAAQRSITYVAGAKYQFRLYINMSSKTYNIYVTPPGSRELTLGKGYSFRTEQSSVSSLANWATTSDSGSHQVCNFRIE